MSLCVQGCDVSSLKINYITPGTVNIPHNDTRFQCRRANGYSPRNSLKPKDELHLPVPLDSVFIMQHNLTDEASELSVGAPDLPVPRTAQGPQRPAALDGFKLLDATGMGFPEDGRAATLSDKFLTTVVEDDLSFFTGLLKLDVSENKLKLNFFSGLPRLKELRIACNMIRTVEPLSGFARLQVLDLSYNALTAEGIQRLYALPSLRELDLCGNELRELPDDFFRFSNLEKVLLEHNMIKDNYVFDVLAKLPRLREVTLAYNSLTSMPMRVTQEGNFK